MKLSRVITSTLGTAMLAGALMLAPQAAEARVFISVGFAPPPIPVYEQPYCPGEGYIWTPGYWEYTDDGYEWIDGAWVVAPYTGALWTPGYWGYGGSGYFWNAGYWGPSVGYYGGINYGFGYFGTGFYGGYWNHGSFFYNRSYNRFDRGRNFGHVYDRRVEGFDGRPGGSSFARGIGNDRRGGSFNDRGAALNNTNRNGFGQGGDRQDFRGDNGGRAINNSNMRGAYTNLNDARNNNPGNNGRSFNQPGNQLGNQPGQVRSGNNVNGGYGSNARPVQPVNQFGGFSNGGRVQTTNPGSNFHPNQGGNPGGFNNAQPRANFGGQQQAPPSNFGGGQSAPRGNPGGGNPGGGARPNGGGGGGAPHGGGAGPHGGGHR